MARQCEPPRAITRDVHTPGIIVSRHTRLKPDHPEPGPPRTIRSLGPQAGIHRGAPSHRTNPTNEELETPMPTTTATKTTATKTTATKTTATKNKPKSQGSSRSRKP